VRRLAHAIDVLVTHRRAQSAGILLVAGCALFWTSWALMPLPGTRDTDRILALVASQRGAVLLSCVVQLASAAAWSVALVIAPGATDRRGRPAWWSGACLLVVGMAGSAADAIYHLVAYELTAPGVAGDTARLVMARVQGPDFLLLLPMVGAFFAGLLLYAVAGVERQLLPRRWLLWFAAAAVGAAAGALLPGLSGSRVTGLFVLGCVVMPTARMGVSLARLPAEAQA